MKPIKILWMTDSPTIFTGFSVVTREVLSRLIATGRYEAACVGWGYNGWPYDRQAHPYDIYPSNAATFGHDVLPTAIQQYQPDIVIALGDLWMLSWMNQLPRGNHKTVIYYPIDGAPLHPSWRRLLHHTDLPIAYSHFGYDLVKKTFPDVHTEMIYHGIDTDVFRPLPNKEAIKEKHHLNGKFVVGCVARNQPRKQLPILIKAFAKFCADKNDVALYMHTNPNDIGWDLHELIQRYRLGPYTRFTRSHSITQGVSAAELNEIYNLFDVMALPSAGEGFGLPLAEAMAAGVPPITTNYSASIELVQGRGELIDVQAFMTDWRCNIEIAIADVDSLVEKLNLL